MSRTRSCWKPVRGGTGRAGALELWQHVGEGQVVLEVPGRLGERADRERRRWRAGRPTIAMPATATPADAMSTVPLQGEPGHQHQRRGKHRADDQVRRPATPGSACGRPGVARRYARRTARRTVRAGNRPGRTLAPPWLRCARAARWRGSAAADRAESSSRRSPRKLRRDGMRRARPGTSTRTSSGSRTGATATTPASAPITANAEPARPDRPKTMCSAWWLPVPMRSTRLWNSGSSKVARSTRLVTSSTLPCTCWVTSSPSTCWRSRCTVLANDCAPATSAMPATHGSTSAKGAAASWRLKERAQRSPGEQQQARRCPGRRQCLQPG